MKRPITLLLTLVLLLGGIFWSMNQTTAGKFGFAASAQDSEIDTSGILEMTLGNPDAKVTVIEYASFTCPHCKNFHADVMPDLKRGYIETGKINFIYREVYFDRFGLWAGMLARCGGPLRYFGISDLLYDQQSDWLDSGDPATIAQNLRTIGKDAGLSDDELQACLTDATKAQAMVALYQINAKADGIDSTPSFVINGEKYGNMTYADFSAILDAKLAE
jgi:protein-disulfide isomerase